MTAHIVKSAARVLEVLELFAEKRQAAAVSELAEALGYPQSSTSVLLRSLEALGYLAYDRVSRRFGPTHRVLLLGSWIELDAKSRDIARILEDLHAKTQETVILAIENGIHAQYIQVLESLSPIRLYLKAGTRRPLVRCAVGWAFLAQKSEAEISLILRRTNAGEAAASRVGEKALFELIGAVRQSGIAITRGHMTPGAGVIATLLPDDNSLARLAVGIGAPIERLDAHRNTIIAALGSLRSCLRGRKDSSRPRRSGAARPAHGVHL